MNPQTVDVVVTTASDGTATAYSPVIKGQVVNCRYIKTDFANGVDFTITTEKMAVSIWTDTDVNASETVTPVTPAQLGTTGGNSTITERPIFLANDRIKIVIAQGGDTKTGTFRFLVA